MPNSVTRSVKFLIAKKIDAYFELVLLTLAFLIGIIFPATVGNLTDNVTVISVTSDVICLGLAIAIFVCGILDKAYAETSSRLFMQLIFLNSIILLADEMSWLLPGTNATINQIYYANLSIYLGEIGIVWIMFFYYVSVLELRSVKMKIKAIIVSVIGVAAIVFCLLNKSMKIYFYIDEMGTYHRADTYPFCLLFSIMVIILTFVDVMRSNASVRVKVSMYIMVFLPLIASVASAFLYEISLVYLAMFECFLIQYGAIYNERGKILHASHEELVYAQKIQQGALDNDFDKYEDFDLFASMDAAREIGGDFFDHYMTDENHLVVTVADVSGKGISAALFMMKAKAELKESVFMGGSLSEIAERANKAICSGNEEFLFVTVWLGIIDLTTGVVKYVNAGHNPPLLIGNEKSEFLTQRSGLFMGARKEMKYKEKEINLKQDDALLLYTDGLTEAVNKRKKQYSSEKLLEFSESIKGLGSKETCLRISEDLEKYCEGREQFDDVTLLCFRR